MFKRGNFEKVINKSPKIVKWCNRCLMSNQRPRISFDKNGICSACNYFDYSQTIDWSKRKSELLKLLDTHRSSDGSWDVVVPSSGGKDSAYVAHKLKYEYGMNPVLVTWSPMQYTDIGLKNFNALNDVGGFTCIKASPNGLLQKKLARLCFEEMGDAFHVFVLGQCFYPTHIALALKIPLIFYGENGEPEYAGDPATVDKPYLDLIKNATWWEDYLKGTNLNTLIDYADKNKKYFSKNNYSLSDLNFFNPPSKKIMVKENISRHYYFSYFEKWHPQENFYYAVENTGFTPNPERNEGTYSKYASLDDKMDGFHYYLRYIKFGLGRCSEDASHEIREGHITREEGLSLMEKYEAEFPNKYFSDFLTYLDINQNDFWEIVDSWRPEHLWEKKGNSWNLKFPPK